MMKIFSVNDERSVAGFYIFIYFLIFILTAFFYRNFFSIVVTTFAIVLILEPMVELLMRIKGMVRTLAMSIALTLFFFSFLILMVLLTPQVIRQAGNFYNFLVNFFENKEWEVYFENYPDIKENISNILENIQPKFLSFVADSIAQITKTTPQVVSFFFYVILGSIYLSIYLPEFKRNIGRMFPRKVRNYAVEFLRDGYKQLRQYVVSLFIVAMIVGVTFWAFLMFMGVKYSILLGFWAALTNLIPIIGVVLEVIPILLTGISMGVSGIVAMVIAIFAIHTTAFVIFLKLMKGYIKINPVAIIFMILFMTEFLGFIGAFVAVPIAILMRVFWNHFVSPKFEEG